MGTTQIASNMGWLFRCEQTLIGEKMRQLSALLLLTIAIAPIAKAQSTLLESVKRNPEEARALCRRFKDLNAKGISASSSQAISEVSRQKNLSPIDAEILSTYVIGLNCPDVR